jgi:hypothetical protein
MAVSSRLQKPKQRSQDLSRRLSALIKGLQVAKVMRADDREVVLEFADGTRLFVDSRDGRLDISVT